MKLDYSVLDRFSFQRKPVGVKFTMRRLDGIKRVEKKINFCEMLKEAQESEPFYAGKEEFVCIEPMLLGLEDPHPIFVGGLIGEAEGLYEEARANRAIYQYLPRMLRGSVRYVTFASVDKLSFDPDVMVFTTDNVGQAQTLLRAVSYRTGQVWSSKTTPVAACSWLYIYPVLTGNINYTVTGLSLGMQASKVFPEGLFLISIPWQILPMVLENLKVMEWGNPLVMPTRDESKERATRLFQRLKEEIGG